MRNNGTMHTYDRISARASGIATIERFAVSVINEAIQIAIAPYTSRIKVQVVCNVINRADAHQYRWYIFAPGKTYLVATYVPRIDRITLTRPLLDGKPIPREIAPWYDRVLHAAHDELRTCGARFYDRDGHFA